MKKEIQNYYVKNGCVPSIGIIFCGNRAVISVREYEKSPREHLDIFYGPFFWYRFTKGCISTFKKALITG